MINYDQYPPTKQDIEDKEFRTRLETIRNEKRRKRELAGICLMTHRPFMNALNRMFYVYRGRVIRIAQ